jgi:hypothetical protein
MYSIPVVLAPFKFGTVVIGSMSTTCELTTGDGCGVSPPLLPLVEPLILHAETSAAKMGNKKNLLERILLFLIKNY